MFRFIENYINRKAQERVANDDESQYYLRLFRVGQKIWDTAIDLEARNVPVAKHYNGNIHIRLLDSGMKIKWRKFDFTLESVYTDPFWNSNDKIRDAARVLGTELGLDHMKTTVWCPTWYMGGTKVKGIDIIEKLGSVMVEDFKELASDNPNLATEVAEDIVADNYRSA